MNPLYRLWWQFLMELQPIVRFGAERLPHLAPWGVRTRTALHLVVGNPVQILATIAGLLVWPPTGIPLRWLWLTLTAVYIGSLVWHRIRFAQGGWLVGWREAWRLRRRWPAVWATVAAKTTRVQAEVGTSNEPIASARLRPIVDHPKLSWLPSIDWPVVSWWVGPPPGRSLVALDELAVVLAANMPRVSDVTIDYEREHDSYGRLIVSFADTTGQVTTPPWHTPVEAPTVLGELPADELDAAVIAFDNEPTYPPLRVVDGELS